MPKRETEVLERDYATALREGIVRPALADALDGALDLVGDRAVYATMATALATALDISAVRGETTGTAQAAKELRAVLAALYGDPAGTAGKGSPAADALAAIQGA